MFALDMCHIHICFYLLSFSLNILLRIPSVTLKEDCFCHIQEDCFCHIQRILLQILARLYQILDVMNLSATHLNY